MRNQFKHLWYRVQNLIFGARRYRRYLEDSVNGLRKVKADQHRQILEMHRRNRQLGERVVQLEEGLGANQEIAELREALAREVETNMKLSADNKELRKALPHDQ